MRVRYHHVCFQPTTLVVAMIHWTGFHPGHLMLALDTEMQVENGKLP
jgi:hypothetical protein